MKAGIEVVIEKDDEGAVLLFASNVENLTLKLKRNSRSAKIKTLVQDHPRKNQI